MAIAFVVATMCLLAVAAWYDVAFRTIPNVLAAGVAALGVVWRAVQGLGAIEVSLLGAGVLFVLLFLIYARGAMGGGDVKLATAVAFGLTPWDTYRFVCATALAGGVLGLAYLAMRRLPAVNRLPSRSRILNRVYVVERWRIRRRGPLPYGVAIAAGGCLTLAHVIGR